VEVPIPYEKVVTVEVTVERVVYKDRHVSVSVCCIVLQCLAVSCCVLQCGIVCCRVLPCIAVWCSVVQHGVACCSIV